MSSEATAVELASSGESLPAFRELNRPARASLRIGVGSFRLQAEAEITPMGLLAIAGLVGTIMLAVAPIVTAAAKASRPR